MCGVHQFRLVTTASTSTPPHAHRPIQMRHTVAQFLCQHSTALTRRSCASDDLLDSESNMETEWSAPVEYANHVASTSQPTTCVHTVPNSTALFVVCLIWLQSCCGLCAAEPVSRLLLLFRCGLGCEGVKEPGAVGDSWRSCVCWRDLTTVPPCAFMLVHCAQTTCVTTCHMCSRNCLRGGQHLTVPGALRVISGCFSSLGCLHGMNEPYSQGGIVLGRLCWCCVFHCAYGQHTRQHLYSVHTRAQQELLWV